MSELSYLKKLLGGVEVEWKSLGEVAEIYGGLTGKTKADFEKGNARYISYKKIFGSLGRVRISTLRNENETFSQLNSITYIGVFLRLVTYSHLP